MATKAVVVPVKRTGLSPDLVLLAGWIVPGLGHIMLRKTYRGVLLFVSVVAMFAIGVSMRGKVYTPTTGDPLDILGFVGDIGAVGLWGVAKLADLGATQLTDAFSDYGSKFIVVAGLLNVMAAVDAQSIANGRKADL